MPLLCCYPVECCVHIHLLCAWIFLSFGSLVKNYDSPLESLHKFEYENKPNFFFVIVVVLVGLDRHKEVRGIQRSIPVYLVDDMLLWIKLTLPKSNRKKEFKWTKVAFSIQALFTRCPAYIFVSWLWNGCLKAVERISSRYNCDD